MPIQNVGRGWTNIRGAHALQMIVLLTVWLAVLPILFYMEAGPQYHQDAEISGVKSATVSHAATHPTDTPSHTRRHALPG